MYSIMRYVCKSDQKPRRHTICFDCGRLSRKRQSKATYHQIFGKAERSEAGNPNYLAELKEDVKAGKFQPEPETLSLTLDLNRKISNPLQNYGWLLLDEIYRSLGISKVFRAHEKETSSQIDLDKSMRLLDGKEGLDPQSKWKSVQSQGDLFGDFDLAAHSVYRALDTFSLLSEEIQLQMHQAITKDVGRTGALVFYDVTNYYFETDLDDEPVEVEGEILPAFRKRGPSKEKRPNPIVQMGLFMDTNGIPIAYRLFPGNCVDVKNLPTGSRTNQETVWHRANCCCS